MFHVLNGDSMVPYWDACGFSGKYLVWREAALIGPASFNPQERAAFLASEYGVSIDDCTASLKDLYKTVVENAPDNELILWFEKDVFCLANVYSILSLLVRQKQASGTISIVLQPFSSLSSSPEKLIEYFNNRTILSHEDKTLAHQVWHAFSKSAPKAFFAFSSLSYNGILSFSSFIRAATAQYPSSRNGLSALQELLLEGLTQGHTSFKELFSFYQANDSYLYGLGDWQLWNELYTLNLGPCPLISLEHPISRTEVFHNSALWNQKINITSVGLEVLKGAADIIALNGIDRWIGGTHLQGKEVSWRRGMHEFIPD